MWRKRHFRTLLCQWRYLSETYNGVRNLSKKLWIKYWTSSVRKINFVHLYVRHLLQHLIIDKASSRFGSDIFNVSLNKTSWNEGICLYLWMSSGLLQLHTSISFLLVPFQHTFQEKESCHSLPLNLQFLSFVILKSATTHVWPRFNKFRAPDRHGD